MDRKYSRLFGRVAKSFLATMQDQGWETLVSLGKDPRENRDPSRV